MSIWKAKCNAWKIKFRIHSMPFPFASQLYRSFIGFIILIWRRFLRGSLSNFIFLLFNFRKFHIYIRSDFTPCCPFPFLSYFSHSCWAFLPSNYSIPLLLCIFYDGDCMQVARNGMCLLLQCAEFSISSNSFPPYSFPCFCRIFCDILWV